MFNWEWIRKCSFRPSCEKEKSFYGWERRSFSNFVESFSHWSLFSVKKFAMRKSGFSIFRDFYWFMAQNGFPEFSFSAQIDGEECSCRRPTNCIWAWKMNRKRHEKSTGLMKIFGTEYYFTRLSLFGGIKTNIQNGKTPFAKTPFFGSRIPTLP